MRLCLRSEKLLSTKVALTLEAMAAQYGGVEIVNMRYELKRHGAMGRLLRRCQSIAPRISAFSSVLANASGAA